MWKKVAAYMIECGSYLQKVFFINICKFYQQVSSGQITWRVATFIYGRLNHPAWSFGANRHVGKWLECKIMILYNQAFALR